MKKTSRGGDEFTTRAFLQVCFNMKIDIDEMAKCGFLEPSTEQEREAALFIIRDALDAGIMKECLGEFNEKPCKDIKEFTGRMLAALAIV